MTDTVLGAQIHVRIESRKHLCLSKTQRGNWFSLQPKECYFVDTCPVQAAVAEESANANSPSHEFRKRSNRERPLFLSCQDCVCDYHLLPLTPNRMSLSISNCLTSVRLRNACLSMYLQVQEVKSGCPETKLSAKNNLMNCRSISHSEITC